MTQARPASFRRFEFRVSDLFRISIFGFRISLSAPARQRLVVFLLGGALFFYGLGDRDLNSSHEARAAQNAQMVLREGNWLLPRLFDGHLELQKPPLYYWLVALVGLAGGGDVGPWAVRLPAALSALGCVLFVHLVGCRVGRPRVGFLAALVLVTCLHFTWLARVGRIDMPLTFMLTVALGSFHIGRAAPPGRGWFLLGYTAVGLGVLLKGPIALVLPALVTLAMRLVPCQVSKEGLRGSRIRENAGDLARILTNAATPELRLGDALVQGPQEPRRSTLWWGLPWVLLIAAPWFIWANLETDGRLWDVFFWYHNVERGLGGSETLKAHPWWFYGPVCLIDLLPWSLALPLLGWAWLQCPELRADPQARLGACWFIAVLAFLSCMSFKRADYLLPAYPGFALLLGCAIERFVSPTRKRGCALLARRANGERFALRRSVFGILVLGMVVGWGWYNTWVVPRQEEGWPYQRIAQEIRAQTERPVIFFRAESHVLAFHVGPPLSTILEWENLQWWVARPFPVYVVMPEADAAAWPRHLRDGGLVEVLRTRERMPGLREHAVVVLRTQPR